MPTVSIADYTITTTTGPNGVTVTLTPNAGTDQQIAGVNVAFLFTRAQTALTNNAAYLAIPSPTQAQAGAQVQSLTRQVDGLIRLALGLLTTTADA